MAVGVQITMPGSTQKQYEEINEKIFGHYPMEPGDAPEGLILHTAGPTREGWYVYDVWETKDDFERFGREHVEPAVKAVTGRELGDELRFFTITNVLGTAREPMRA